MTPPDDRRSTIPEPPLPSSGPGRLWRLADASVRTRVLVPTVIMFTVITGLTVGVAIRLHSADMRRQQEDHSRVVARMVRSELSAEMLNAGVEHVPALLEQLVAFRPNVHSISIVRSTGEISVSSDQGLIGTRPWGPMEGYTEPTLVRSRSDGDQFAVVEPIPNQEACVRCHQQREVGESNGWLDVRLARGPTTDWHLARVMALTSIPMLFLLLGILWWLLGRQVTKPLHRLMGTMQRARRGIGMVPADEGRADELGEVARSFDATFGALRRAQREVEHFYRERSLQVDRFAAVGELATGLAHEIKNPLAGLSGALELLAEDLKGEFQTEIVGEMRIQLERLTQTMNGMLNFARPPKVHLRPTDLRDCVSNVVFLLRQHVRKQAGKITLTFDIHEDVPLAQADPTQLEQALLNISLNAVQAMREGGGELAIRAFCEEELITIEIADTGPGIPEDVRERIFEPYFTTKGGGTGLGLALSARIISDHSGSIEYDCPPEGGTIFHISLKQAPSKEIKGIAI
jgi:signal transduction histidine kinase